MASCVSSLCFCVLVAAVMVGLWVRCDDTESLCGADAPGDIRIGILSSVHCEIKGLQPWTLPEMPSCVNFDLITFVQALAAIHTIETINDSGFLPGIRLGYLMCDPCAYATRSLHCVMDMLAVNGSLTVLPDFSSFKPRVKAFLGERYTETSIPMTKILGLYRIPQVACTSSAAALSDKSRYTSFFRVIPSNFYQTKALAKLLKLFKCDCVGVVTLDDEYGKGIFDNFLPNANEEKICLAFHEVVLNYVNVNQRIKEVADRIRSSPKVKVVLLILRFQQVEMLFQEMINTNTSRIWIASNTWSLERPLMKMKDINSLGEIIGTTFVTGNIPGFDDYLQNLTKRPDVRNDFIREYKDMRFNCSSGQQSEHTSPLACNVTDPQEANDDYLLRAVDTTEAYSQRVAVYAIANAIRSLLKCNDTACSGDTDFLPWKLVDILRKMNYTLDNQTHSFNENGDFEDGYDIVRWKRHGDERVSEVVGKFFIKTENIELYEHNVQWFNDLVPQARCSEPCPPGTYKVISSTVCFYNCSSCSVGFYSNESDQTICTKCPDNSSSLEGSKECQKLKIWYLEWSAAYSIVVMVGTVIGALLLLFSFIFFILHRENNIIKKILVTSCLMKCGLLLSFGGVIAFLGNPNIHLCRAQQTMYALGFTLCVSCVLVKASHTFIVVMSDNPNRQRKLRKFDKPFVIIGVLTASQALICIFWLIFDPVDVKLMPSKSQPLMLNRLCTQGSMYGFGAMHVYIASLAIICFLLGFRGKDAETEPIVFSMLIHLFSWLCFIPVYITQEESRPIVQISAIMVSSYGIIFCHFTPKWIKILPETVKKLNPPPTTPVGPPGGDTELTYDSRDETDSGLSSPRYGLRTSISMSSLSLGRFSFADSEISTWDCTSLQSTEDQVVSFRCRRPSSQSQKTLSYSEQTQQSDR